MVPLCNLHLFLGRCPQCMRKAFLSAGASWTVTLILLPLGITALLVPAIAISIALTVLWLAHVVARAINVQRICTQETASAQLSRRHLGIFFFKSLIAVSVASAIPSLAAWTCSDCEAARQQCFSNCPSGGTSPDCIKACYQKYACVPGRDCNN